MAILRLRKVADRSSGQRLVRYDEVTGEKYLLNPKTGSKESWPLAGIEFEGSIPKITGISVAKLSEGMKEGWIEAVNYRVVNCLGGSVNNPLEARKMHNFPQADFLIFKCISGNVKYKVIKQPGKYYANGDLATVDTVQRYKTDNPGSQINWYFELQLVGE